MRSPTITAMRNQSTADRAFTLVELLIVLAIIFLLITVAFVAFAKARKTASRVESLNALRQMMAGYTSYSGEHKGRLMPGYLDPNMIGTLPNQLNIKAKLQNGYALNAQDPAGYVWRLAPYLDYAWKTYTVDYRSSAIDNYLTREFATGLAGGKYGPGTAGTATASIGFTPSFGLNSVYVGGDAIHGDPNLSPWANWPNNNPNTVAATRLSEVKFPAKLIVFGSTRHSKMQNLGDALTKEAKGKYGLDYGYVELSAPFANFDPVGQVGTLPQWTIDTAVGSPTQGQIIFSGMGTYAGVPIDRLGQDMLNIGFLDGSVGTEAISRLEKDMSRWSPFALSTQ